MSFVERAGNTALLLPVDGEGDLEGNLLRGGDSTPFDPGLMSYHVLSVMLLCVPCPSGLRQLHLDL